MDFGFLQNSSRLLAKLVTRILDLATVYESRKLGDGIVFAIDFS